jgi:excisionase family DNA binding protein
VERSSSTRLAYTVHEVGELLGGASETAVRHLIDRHALPARRLGQRRVVVLARDLEQYLAALPRIDSDEAVPA